MATRTMCCLCAPFAWVFEGGEIPTNGAAVKDGDFYLNGERQGRALKVESTFVLGQVAVTYLTANHLQAVGFRVPTTTGAA